MVALGILVPSVRVRISTSQPYSRNIRKTSTLDDFSSLNGTESGQQIFLLYDTIVELCKEKKMYFCQPILGRDYLPAKLSQGKTWFVYFYVKSPVSGKLQRRRIKVNRYSTRKENLVLARSIIGDINARLALGWNPLLEGVAFRAGVPLFDALDDYLKIKAKEMPGFLVGCGQCLDFLLGVFVTLWAEIGINGGQFLLRFLQLLPEFVVSLCCVESRFFSSVAVDEDIQP